MTQKNQQYCITNLGVYAGYKYTIRDYGKSKMVSFNLMKPSSDFAQRMNSCVLNIDKIEKKVCLLLMILCGCFCGSFSTTITNIFQSYSFFCPEPTKSPWMVFEYMALGDLANLLRSRSPPLHTTATSAGRTRRNRNAHCTKESTRFDMINDDSANSAAKLLDSHCGSEATTACLESSGSSWTALSNESSPESNLLLNPTEKRLESTRLHAEKLEKEDEASTTSKKDKTPFSQVCQFYR